MKNWCFLLFIFFSLQKIEGQNVKDPTDLTKKDSTQNIYKEKLDRYMGVRLDLNTNVSTFSFINQPPLRNFDLQPNLDYQTRVAVSYKWLTLAYSFSPKVGSLNDNEREKGKTKITGLDFSFNFKKTQHRLFFASTKGYFLSNSDIYRNELNEQKIFGKYAKLPDFESLQLGSENFYFFNSDKYSKVFAKDKSEIQLKSAGSWVGFLGFYYSKIDGRKQDLPFLQFVFDQRLTYPTLNESYYSVVGTGYSYNFILPKHFFITTLAIPAVGIQYSRQSYPQYSADKNKTELAVAIVTEGSLGYNTKNWFTGILGTFNGFTSASKGNRLAGARGYATFFIGYRFAPPKVVKNTFDYIDEKL